MVPKQNNQMMIERVQMTTEKKTHSANRAFL